MKIKYGLLDNHIDVTDICKDNLLTNNIITIPNGDINRSKLFTDPIPNVKKKIIIEHNGIITETPKTTIIKIHIKDNKETYSTNNSIIDLSVSKLKIKYGLLDNHIDVTKICKEKLLTNNIITIPGGNTNKLFNDPIPNVKKKIIIDIDNIITEYDENTNIKINFKDDKEKGNLESLNNNIKCNEKIGDDKKKICFITCWFSKPNDKIDKEGSFKLNPNYDYYLFTNLPNIKTRLNKIVLEDDYFLDIKKNKTKSRYPKFMAWDYFKKKGIYYDLIIYYDYHVEIKNLDLKKYLITINNHPTGCSFYTHPKKNDAYQECDAIFNCKKDTKRNLDLTKNFLKNNNFPKNQWMSENMFFIYNPNNTVITNCFKEFWDLYSKETLTHRDQPFLSYFFYKHKIKPIDLNLRSHFNPGKRANRI